MKKSCHGKASRRRQKKTCEHVLFHRWIVQNMHRFENHGCMPNSKSTFDTTVLTEQCLAAYIMHKPIKSSTYLRGFPNDMRYRKNEKLRIRNAMESKEQFASMYKQRGLPGDCVHHVFKILASCHHPDISLTTGGN